MLSSRIYTGWTELEPLAAEWDRLLKAGTAGVSGPDATCSWTWAQALSQSLLKDVSPATLVARDDGAPVAIIPLYAAPRAHALAPRELRLITEAYAGRSDLLIDGPAAEVLEHVLGQAVRQLASWDTLSFTVVEDSRTHQALMQLADSGKLRLRCISASQSPYIELGKTWDAILAALPKKMRWTIRKSENDLAAMGLLDYQCCRTPDSVEALLQGIYTIERKSWKEASGSSITTQERQREFYERFVRLAAGSGMLCAHLLRLDGRPIAYILGIESGDGVFLDLKESFDTDFSAQSPGHVLKHFAFETLLSRGVSLYDFMGECEPYKMRWTERKYRRLTFRLYNGTWRGRLAWWRNRLSRTHPAARPAQGA
jgi:CelD/BcsL family acetyltransferase involved in cellulose biosynthesis